MKRPFIFILIPLTLGISIAYCFHVSIIFIFFLILFSLGGFIINLRRAINNAIFLFVILIALGMLLTNYALNNSILSTKVDKNVIISGTVDEVVKEDEDLGKYILRVNYLEDDSFHIKVNEKIILKVIGTNNIGIGDKMVFQGKLKIPLENTNPGLFNYRLNLLSNKIYTTITIKDYAIIGINSEGKSIKYRIKYSFRENVEKLFDNNLNKDNSDLMKSIILGDYSYLNEDDILKYRDLGLAHILAVSGLHIGIIAGFLIYILSHLGVKRKINIIITLATIWLYGYLIGFPPSLLRANIMISILFYSQLSVEPYDSINSLFFAAFVLLIINPIWLFNLGFQLSFLATFSIIYFTPKFNELFYPYNNKITYSLAGLLAVQIGLLPIQAFYFNKIPILSIFSNLFIAPILSFSLIIGGVMVGLSYSIPILNLIVGKILNLILSIQYFIVDLFYDLPFGIIEVHSPNVIEIIMYYIIILMIFGVIRFEKLNIRIKKLIMYYLLVLILFNSIVLVSDKSIEMHFIDVGQGDSILLRTKVGDYLIDTGGNIMDSFDVGKNITLPYLQKLGIKRLEGVFITHFDDDHCKSLPLLIDNLVIDNVLISYEDNNNEIYNKVKESNLPIIILKERNLIKLDKNMSLKVLSPNQELQNRGLNPNNLSMVFLLSYYDRNILFTGDIEKEVEIQIVDKIKNPVDVIKVPHHGSNTSSTEELLYKIKPEIGIISVGRNNFYGHPNKEVLSRYEEIGTKIYRTDNNGMIKLILDKDKLEIKPFVQEKSRLIDFITENILQISFYAIYYLISFIFVKIYGGLEKELFISEL